MVSRLSYSFSLCRRLVALGDLAFPSLCPQRLCYPQNLPMRTERCTPPADTRILLRGGTVATANSDGVRWRESAQAPSWQPRTRIAQANPTTYTLRRRVPRGCRSCLVVMLVCARFSNRAYPIRRSPIGWDSGWPRTMDSHPSARLVCPTR